MRLTLCLLLVLTFSSCNTSNGIDDYFTFNLSASHSLTADNLLFQSEPVRIPISISVDSTNLGKNGTEMQLVKSVKLNSLKLVSLLSGYSFSKIDTAIFSVQADSLGSQIVATYSGANDSVYYTNIDFVTFVKGRNATFVLSMSSKTPPSTPLNFTVATTNVLTARPLQ